MRETECGLRIWSGKACKVRKNASADSEKTAVKEGQAALRHLTRHPEVLNGIYGVGGACAPDAARPGAWRRGNGGTQDGTHEY